MTTTKQNRILGKSRSSLRLKINSESAKIPFVLQEKNTHCNLIHALSGGKIRFVT